MVGTMTAAALGAWLTIRSRRREPREDFREVSGLPALGQFGFYEISDDRAAEIIQQFAPALNAAVRAVP